MSKLISLCVLFAFACMALFSTGLNAQCGSSDLAAQASGVPPSTCGNCDGSASVVGTGGTAPYSYQWSTGDTTATIGTAFGGAPLCINTGGTQLVASNGNTFTDDQYFSGGTSFSNAIAIANTNDDILFQDERFVGNGGFFSYNIPVSNGNHLVELYFAEIFFGTSPTRPGGVGSRLFDVTIEGVLVLDDYDIFLDAGGPAIAIIKSFNVNVTDGSLNILFDGVVNNAKINALCVTPVSSTGVLCSGTYAVTVTDALGCTATTDVTLSPGSCNDNNSCTIDTCDTDQCVFTAVICDDGDACTADSCVNGACSFTAIICNDGDGCTTDACDSGNCVYTAIPGCNDPCANSTLALSFSVQNACLGDTAIITNNSVGIDPAATFYLDQNSDGSIDNTFPAAAFPVGSTQNRVLQQANESFTLIAENPNGCTDTFVVAFTAVVCDDGDACTSNNCSDETCAYPAITCDDGDACTTDACDNGNCINTPIPGCNDPCANSTLALSFSVQNACLGDTAIITNNSVGIDPAATFYLDQNSDGTIDNTFPAAAFPVGASQNRVLQQATESFTLIAENPDGCTDTFVVAFTAVVCDDGDACTSDNCSDETCSYPAITCDDGDDCTNDVCNNGTCSNSPINCNDHDNCTTDACANGQCINTPVSCDDSDDCTTDACSNGNCTNTTIDCADGDACTTDSCNGGVCVNLPIPGCSDPCLSLNCDDNDACTTDGCANGTCTYTSACDDNDACTMETCHIENDDDDDDGYHHNHHHHGHHNDDDDDDGDDDDDNSAYHCHRRDVICNDNNKCTDDECVNGVCVYTPKVCEDNNPCTDNTCYRGYCKFPDVNCRDNDPCTFDSCGAGTCFNIVRNCEEGDLCTVDYCIPYSHNDDRWWDFWDWFNFDTRYRNTTCVHQPVSCSDSNACTDDECNAGNCTNTAIANCCLTDADCDDSNACTVDECRYKTCRNRTDVLEIEERQSNCQNGTATLELSELGDTYLWSTGETTETIEGTPGATYSVTVTWTNGCIKTASITVSDGAELLSSYVILAEEEVKMYKNTVFSGGVGVTDNNGKARLKNQTKITAAGTFVQADIIQVSSGSQVATGNPNPANVDFPAFETNPYCNWSSNNVNVGQNQNITLSGSVYNNITVNRNATVTFTSANLNIKSLYLKDNVTVRFADCSRVKICKWLRLGADNTFNPGQVDVVVFVEDEVEIGAGSTVHANIYQRDGWFTVKASSANDPTRLTGLFIAERFDADENAHWFADTTCNSSCAPAFQQLVAAKVSEEEVSEEGGVESAFTMDDITNGVHLKSYPNPFTDKLNIEFSLDTDTRAKLEVYNLTGQLIATLFEGDVTGGAIQRFEFTPQTNAEGVYIYRLQTATETFVGKAIMAK